MRTLILLAVYALLAALLIPFLLFSYLAGGGKLLIWIGKRGLRLGQIILGIRLDVSGREEIDKKAPYIFMANHLSLIDGPLLFMLIPQDARVILKQEIFRIPIIGQAMKQAGFVPVDRKRLKGGVESIGKASWLLKEKGFSFLIFPEGTRSLDGRLQSLKRGGFILAANCQAALVPVTIKGSFKVMPKGSFFVRKGKIRVIFHPPVSSKGFDRHNLPELMERVRNTIQKGLDD